MYKKRHQKFFFIALFFLIILVSTSLISLATSGALLEQPSEENAVALAGELPERVELHHWDFDDEVDRLNGATVTGDRSDNTGGTITFEPSETTGGYAARFDGNSGLSLGADLINTNTYTISFWLNPTAITAFTPAFWAINESPTQWMSILPQAWWGGAGVWMYGPWQDIDPGSMHHMTINQWHHFAITVNAGHATVYLDNLVIAESPAINNVFGRGGAEFFLGVNQWDLPFNGLIDEVRLYNNAALTPAGIAALFNFEDPALPDFIVPAPIDVESWVMPGANRDFADRPAPDFQNATVHDPAMTRRSITRPDGDWHYIIGTFLGAARTQDFVQFEPIDYGLGSPNLRNTHGHRFMPVDNPDPSVQTFEEQVRSVISDGGGNPPRRTDGAFTPGTVDDLVIWASDIIEVPDVDGDGSRFFQYYSFSHWGVPDSAIGLAIADTIDGPWITQGLLVRSRHGNNNQAMDGTPFIRHFHPNAIDPYPMFCNEGRFWLVYGSWEGGVFILELDPETGMLLEGSELNTEHNGYGRLLVNSNSNSIEGAHMVYSPTSGMYYLFASWGSLASYAGYNVRMFRSENPYGPFEDARFRQMHVATNNNQGNQNRVDITGETFHHTNAAGVKIIGGYRFVGTDAENSLGRGYLSPGHGSMNWDPINERYMKIFHTRFVGGGESHQIRAHEMFMNDNGWFVMAPLRFDGVGGTQAFYPEDLVGDYKILSHGRGTNTTATLSNVYRFNEVGHIVASNDSVVGTWRLTGDYTATIQLRNITYTGLFLRQFCDDTSTWVQTFTVLSYDEGFDDNDLTTPNRNSSTAGIALWGVGVSAGVEFEGEVNFDDGPIITDPVLTPVVPERNDDGAIVWTFNNSFDGGIPVARESFDNIILPTNRQPDESITFVDDRHGNPNSAIRFGGNAANAGLYLGEDIIDTANYTVAFWIRPENLANTFGSVFFGAVANDTWKSLHPATGQSYGDGPGTLAYWSGSYQPNPWRNNVSNGRLTSNEWSHVTVVVNNGTASMFLDGVPLDMFRSGFPAGTNMAPMFAGETGRFFLGLNFFPDPIFTGAVDDLHIFDRALTASQVMRLFDPDYESDLTPAATPVVPPLINGAHHWSFDEDLSGAAEVRSQEGFVNVDTTLRGNVPRVPGRDGGYAAHFTGTGGGLYLGDNIINGDTYTIAFWANPETISEWTSMFFGGNTARHLSITGRHGGGSTTAFLVPGHQWHFHPGVVPTNTWTHFAFTSNGDQSSFYVNGQRTYTVNNPTDVFGPLANSQFFLGVNLFNDAAFRGLVDELFIFPETALNVLEIRELAGIEIEGQFIMPGANMNYNDPESPVFIETSVHDPSLIRNRAADGWFYAIGTDLGAARTQDFIQWEAINYGLGNPQVGNPGNTHAFFPTDNPDPDVETMEQQIRYIGAFHQNTPNNAIFWAGEIIEVEGRFFQYYSLAGGINEWNWPGRDPQMPQAGLGVAVADSIDGPWITQGTFIRSGYSNRYHNGARVPFNDPLGQNMSMDGVTPFDHRIHPNSIDSSPFLDENGNLWLVYGSYGGGIFLLEMDRETGLPLENSEINLENNGYGRLILALTHHQGEGPHMIYSETSGYYYLFLTYGWLASYGGYNVRMWRSETPYGPFEDARFGQVHVQSNPLQTGGAARWLDVDGSEFTHGQMGNKIIGGHHFVSAPNELAMSTAYQSPGHGGLIYYEGRYLKVFHTRFAGRWEWHQVRVHEAFMNSNGWFVVAPLRFDGGEGARAFDAAALVGDFKILHHERDTNATAHTSSLYRLNSDGTITNDVGTAVGIWQLSGDNIANIELYDITYNGVFLRQFDPASEEWVQTFTALSYDNENPSGTGSTAGLTIWGKGISAGDAYDAPISTCEVVAAGQFAGADGSEWRICGDGTLEIDSGFINWTGALSPWHVHRALITQIEITGPITAGPSLRALFRELTEVTEIEGLTHFNTTATTTMYRMFFGASGVTSLDVSSFDTGNVTSMALMFRDASNLVSLDVSGFDTENVTDMREMFRGTQLTQLDLSSFDTSNVTTMNHMFTALNTLRELTLGESFSFIGVPNLVPIRQTESYTGLWQGAGGAFTSAQLTSQFDGSTMAGTFVWQEWTEPEPELCEVVARGRFANGATVAGAEWRLCDDGTLEVDSGFINWTLVTSPWHAHRADITEIVFTGPITAGTSLRSLFHDLFNVTAIEGLTYFDTSNVTNMGRMFRGASSLTELDLSSFDTSSVTDMGWMFFGASGLETLDVTGFDTSNVVDMGLMFRETSSIVALDVTNFETENVVDMREMFRGMSSLETLDLSSFDTGNVLNMNHMFVGLTSLKELILGDLFDPIGSPGIPRLN